MSAELTLSYAGSLELQRDYDANLRKGRAFVPQASGWSELARCTLRIVHPSGGASLELAAEAVWISDDPAQGGVGLELLHFDAELRERLRAFVSGESAGGAPALGRDAAGRTPSRGTSPAAASPAPQSIGAAPRSSEPGRGHLHDRVRNLSLAERDVMARQGSLPERVALERRFGSSVWEGLLQNPQLTAREACHMAKSPSLPAHLVNLIVSNAAWLADPSVQTALLHNPRVSGPHLDRVLRALSQSELRRLAEQTSVRMQVRTAAKRLIRR